MQFSAVQCSAVQCSAVNILEGGQEALGTWEGQGGQSLAERGRDRWPGGDKGQGWLDNSWRILGANCRIAAFIPCRTAVELRIQDGSPEHHVCSLPSLQVTKESSTWVSSI